MIRVLVTRILCAGMFFCTAGALFGQEFSAEVVTNRADTSEPSPIAKIYVGKDKVRIEPHEQAGMTGMGAVIISDLNGQNSVYLMPQRHMYMQSMPGRGTQNLFSLFHTLDVENACSDWLKWSHKPGNTCIKVGYEAVNGRDTVKYEGKSAAGDVGDAWLDAKLKFAVKWKDTKKGGELRNIKEGSQPASLFEIPADYQKMDMGGMMMDQHKPNQ